MDLHKKFCANVLVGLGVFLLGPFVIVSMPFFVIGWIANKVTGGKMFYQEF